MGLWDDRRESRGIRILLGEAASRALLDAGTVFVIAGRASHPDPGHRVALHLVPIDKETGDKLCGILMGTHRAVRRNHPETQASE